MSSQNKKSSAPQDFIKNRAERFQLTGLHRAKFSFQMTPNSPFIPTTLNNLSIQGLAFLLPNANTNLKVGDSIAATLEIDGTLFKLVLNVRHLTSGAAGCRIESSDHNIGDFVDSYFLNEIAAAKLIEAEPPKELIGPGVNGKYYASNDRSFSLFYTENRGRVQSMWVGLLGNTIEMDQEGQIIYGFLMEGEDLGQSNHIRVKVHDLPEEIFTYAMRFVSGISSLPSNIKGDLISMLEHGRHKKIE